MDPPQADVKADVMAMANAFRAASVSRTRLKSGDVNSDGEVSWKAMDIDHSRYFDYESF